MAITYLSGGRIQGTSTNIVKDTQVQKQTASSGTTISEDITIGNNVNRILIVTTSIYSSQCPAPTGITFGSQDLTQGDYTLSVGDGSGRADIWYLVAPTVGTDTITVTWGQSETKKAFLAYSFYGVNQSSTPIGIIASDSSTGQESTISESITPTTAGSMILDSLSWILGGSNLARPVESLTAGGFNIYTGGKTGASQYDLTPTINSANTMGWTSLANIGGSTSEAAWWRWIACEVKPYEVASKLTISNVPTGTRYEETDTRKIFRRKHTDASTVWSQLTSNDAAQVNNTNATEDIMLGQEFQANHANIGLSFDKVTIRIRNHFSDSATYAIPMKVWNTGTGNTPKATSPTVVTLADLETGGSWDSSAPYDDAVVYTFTTPVTLAAGDIIGVEPQGGTFNSSSVTYRQTTSDTESNTRMNSYRNSAWSGNVGYFTDESYMILELQESDSWVEKGTA